MRHVSAACRRKAMRERMLTAALRQCTILHRRTVHRPDPC
jgi:hypothetical protein